MDLFTLMDSTNFEHSQTVSQISRLMARKAGFSENECQVIAQAALCHDVGKSAIPADILNKPASLTPAEYEIIKTHTTAGHEQITSVIQTLSIAATVALQHHEHIDGLGYDRLAGADIHPYAKLVAVADVFDALLEIVILTITMTQKTADEAAVQYGFTQMQRDQLRELSSPEYAELWAALIGGSVAGDGTILIGNPGFVPTDIFSWPLAEDYPVNSGFGYRADPFDPSQTVFHGGVDIACPEGTPILAAADGTVVVANATDPWGGSWGYYVKIQHDGTFSTLYAHCSRIAVTNGQQVQKGQVIGYVGTTGNSSGNHLHFEVYVNGTRVDPMDYFE